MLDDFHFLRPAWLLALPVGVALIVYAFRAHASGGAWRRVVDRALQPFVLTSADRYTGRRWPLVAAVAAWTVATVALAGPAWQRLPVPAFRTNEALVVALDLSRSMDAADLAPSRLTRAKLKLLSLLDRRDGGQTGLVVFSTHAFTVTPLTTDTRTIASLVAALTTDIMPTQGSSIAAGIEKAASLLRQANVTDGRILLMTDAEPTPADVDAVRSVAGDGIAVSVLAVGTEDGAPIPQPTGGFVTDGSGNVVVPKLDARRLAALAAAGGGRFSTLTADDGDLERLEPPQEAGEIVESGEDTRVADVWQDAGLYFAVLLLPLVALGFRRGWIAVFALCLLVPHPQVRAQEPAEGSGAESVGDGLVDWWASLWRRADQRGMDAMAAERPERAARLFDDPEWRAAAQYRAGDYSASARSLAGIDTADAHYNRGNALARAGEIESAIAEYDRALELDPEHEDARYNRDLLKERLAQNPPPQQQQSAAGQEQQDEQQGQGESGDAPQQAQNGDTGGDETQQAREGSESQPSQGEPGDDGEQSDGAEPQVASAEPGEPSDEGQADADAEPDDADAEQADAEGEPAASDDLERWASDQAAEQWLRRIRQDPGGLLRRKFLYQYQRLGIDQDGRYTRDEAQPW
ncbi:MAG TPA: VWA domain-containing protein [Gammaproteobacteria bacterium]